MIDEDLYNTGLPKLSYDSGRAYSYFEFWPAWIFYAPVVMYWLWLSLRYQSFRLPLLVNPSIYLSGMVGESKSEILDQFDSAASPYMLPYRCFTRSRNTLDDLKLVCAWQGESGVGYPCVIKPDLGCRGSGVSKIKDKEALRAYIASFPIGHAFIVQALSPYIAEAGIFYQREPGTENAEITSITLKYLPYVVGDGKSDLRTLILADRRCKKLRHIYFAKFKHSLASIPVKGEVRPLVFSGSHCRGAIFRDGTDLATADMLASIERCLQGLPDFHYGRFDIKFKDIESLQRGDNFHIIELNGASSEATHIWDANARLRDVYATLFKQYRTLFAFGYKMLKQNQVNWSLKHVLVHWLRGLKQGKSHPQAH